MERRDSDRSDSRVSQRKISRRTCLLATGSVGSIAYFGSAPVMGDTGTPEERVLKAVSSARSYILDSDDYNGEYWISEIAQGPQPYWDVRYTTEYAIVFKHLNISEESREAAIDYILSKRSEGGGWNDMLANYQGALLFDLVDGYNDVRKDIKAEIKREGMDLVKSSGLGPRENVIHYRLRLFYAILSDRYTTKELFPDGSLTQIPSLLFATPAFKNGFDPTKYAVNQNALELMLVFVVMAASAKENPSKETQKQAKFIEEVILDRRQTNGVWSTGFDTLYSIFSLSLQGYDTKDTELSHAIKWLVENRQSANGRFIPFRTPVWDTAWTVQALLASGMSIDTKEIRDAMQWLADVRTTTDISKTPLELHLDRPPLPFRKHTGYGWSYKPHMHSNWGETSIVTRTLKQFDDRITEDHIEFLFEVQNENGSWSTWSHGDEFEPFAPEDRKKIIKQLGYDTYRTLFGDEPALGLTGHVLMTMGEHGYTVSNNQAVHRAADWLVGMRDSTSMWPSKWGIRHTYGTSRAIIGLDQVEYDITASEIQHATNALKANQNDDGGWGERLPPNRAVWPDDDIPYLTADSTPEQTSWALEALLGADIDPNDKSVQRGVEYLLETQRDDGSWPVSDVMFQGAPPSYVDAAWTQASALQALSMYAQAISLSTAPDRNRSVLDGIPRWTAVLAGQAGLIGAAALHTLRETDE